MYNVDAPRMILTAPISKPKNTLILHQFALICKNDGFCISFLYTTLWFDEIVNCKQCLVSRSIGNIALYRTDEVLMGAHRFWPKYDKLSIFTAVKNVILHRHVCKRNVTFSDIHFYLETVETKGKIS